MDKNDNFQRVVPGLEPTLSRCFLETSHGDESMLETFDRVGSRPGNIRRLLEK